LIVFWPEGLRRIPAFDQMFRQSGGMLLKLV
jgi:hypothetical protein